MHEAAIAQSIIADLERRLEQGRILGRVRLISLSVGRLTAVVPENLRFLFGVLARDSALGQARLEIELIPIRTRCGACLAEFEVDNICFECAACGSLDLEIIGGRELIVDSVEVEQ